ncbi:MAG: tetratricopeptide repeat protein [Candidatus Kapaibacterium sp.]
MKTDSHLSTSSILTLQLAETKSDSARFSLLRSLSGQLFSTRPEQALSYANEALELAERLRKRREVPDCQVMIGRCQIAAGDLDRGVRSLRKALPLLPSPSEEEGELYVEIGSVEVERGRYQKGVEAYQAAHAVFEEIKNLSGRWRALKGLGDLYTGLADYQRGLDVYLRALRIAEKSKNFELLGVSLSDIALVYSELQDYPRALTYLEQCRETFSKAGLRHLEVRALANISGIYTAQGKLEKGLEQGIRTLAIYEALDDRRGLATMLVNLSNIYEQRGQFDQALEYSRKALDLFEELGDPEGGCRTLINIGILYRATGQHNNALYILEQALRIASNIETLGLEYQCHHLLSASLEELGDTTRALRHLRAYIDIKEKLEGEERNRGIAELQAKFDLEQAETEREIYRLRNEQLELQNKHQSAELTSLSMRLVEKSRFINDIKLAIEKTEQVRPDEVLPSLHQILRKIKGQTSSREDWQAFEEQFQKVHHGFMQRLSQQFSTLTSTELKVCALIRTGLSSSEIGSLLHVTKRNIDTHRYRLRKKLEIGSDVDLGTFLAGL